MKYYLYLYFMLLDRYFDDDDNINHTEDLRTKIICITKNQSFINLSRIIPQGKYIILNASVIIAFPCRKLADQMMVLNKVLLLLYDSDVRMDSAAEQLSCVYGQHTNFDCGRST